MGSVAKVSIYWQSLPRVRAGLLLLFPHSPLKMFQVYWFLNYNLKGAFRQRSTRLPARSRRCNCPLTPIPFPTHQWSLSGWGAHCWRRFRVSFEIFKNFENNSLWRYICYDMMHYYTHHGQMTKGSYLDRLRKYHIDHHFIDPTKGESN